MTFCLLLLSFIYLISIYLKQIWGRGIPDVLTSRYFDTKMTVVFVIVLRSVQKVNVG